MSIRIVVLCALIGCLGGVALTTFIYAKGYSYLSSDPSACVNCHVMQPQFDGWQKSSHHTAAVCVDCHMPAGFFEKYFVKAENGFLHSKAFTLQNYLDPLQIRPKSLAVANNACMKCHSDMTQELSVHEAVKNGEPEQCTKCHADVGH